MTPMGDLLAISKQTLRDAATQARKLRFAVAAARSGNTSPTSPRFFASADFIFLPVNASSRTVESFPTILGKRWRVPMSAQMPMFTSAMQKKVSSVQYRMSAAQARSMPPPMTPLCSATTTGLQQPSRELMAAWYSEMPFSIRSARRLTSSLPPSAPPSKPPPSPPASSLCRSRPQVNMRARPPWSSTQWTSGSVLAVLRHCLSSMKS
mmetsp:Transcript_23827/g.76798  ORF Transcript_23827/g.76798 Transcript_23827/m.76798 type:complete len:208 (-) Transcript_23827:176-799(-)